MKQLEERHFQSDENKIFVRKTDNIKFGTDIYLAANDSIENYDEIDMDEEDKEWFKNLQEEHNKLKMEMEDKFNNIRNNSKKQKRI